MILQFDIQNNNQRNLYQIICEAFEHQHSQPDWEQSGFLSSFGFVTIIFYHVDCHLDSISSTSGVEDS
jgi:hypothetical protein